LCFLSIEVIGASGIQLKVKKNGVDELLVFIQ